MKLLAAAWTMVQGQRLAPLILIACLKRRLKECYAWGQELKSIYRNKHETTQIYEEQSVRAFAPHRPGRKKIPPPKKNNR